MTDLTELLVTEDMHERKMLHVRARGCLRRPPRRRRHAGGTRRADDLVAARPAQEAGPLANIAGFWDPLLKLLDEHARATDFIRAGMEVSYLVAEDVEEIVPMLRQAPSPTGPRRQLEEPAEAVVQRM